MESACRIFLSYARRDGEAFSSDLRRRLEREHPELTVWQDRDRLEGGVGWWAQIVDAINQVQFLVAVMTESALHSEVTAKEWKHARQEGVCVFPVIAMPSASVEWGSIPNWMRKLHFYDLDKEWDTFVAHLLAPCTAVRAPFMAPDFGAEQIRRGQEYERTVLTLLESTRRGVPSDAVVLRGAGGVGKSNLAATVCQDERIMTSFDDGILWVTLGERPNIQRELAKLYAAVTGERPGFVDLDDVVLNLASRLDSKDCLLVIDDAWHPADLLSFFRAASGCAKLITTRQLDVAIDATQISVGAMTNHEALSMFSALLEESSDQWPELSSLADRLGRWPLLLRLTLGALQHYSNAAIHCLERSSM